MANLFGTSGDDTLIGTDADDALFGGDGNDLLDGRFGFDTLNGGTGRDTVTYAFYAGGINANLETGVVGFPGNSTLTDTLISIENLVGSGGNDTIIGTIENNVLWGGEGNDTIYGGFGNDTLDGGFGFDILDGGEGIDTVTYDFYDGGINANLETGVVGFPGNSTLTDTLTNVENLIGSRGDDTITGNWGDNSLSGGEGNDVISGSFGDDILSGGNGDDILDGGFGFDTMDGGEGIDTVTYDFYDGGIEADLETGVIGFPGNSTLTDTVRNVENLMGSRGNDRIYGDAKNNVLSGNSGNDILDGRAGIDTLAGGLGDDTYILNDSDQVVEAAGAGTDTVLASYSYTLGEHVENLTLTGTSSISGTGNGLNNIIQGNAGSNTLDGKAGVDVLSGGAGNDFYIVSDAGDRAIESANQGYDIVGSFVSFTLEAHLESLALLGTGNLNGVGNAQDNYLVGNIGVNSLDGAAGNDTLIGLTGADTLKGGLGADKFVFSTANEGVDRIVDFSRRQGDKVVLVANGFKDLVAGRLNSDQFVTGAAAKDAEDRFIYNRKTGELFYDADGRGGVAQVKLAHFENRPALGVNDFLVVASPLG